MKQESSMNPFSKNDIDMVLIFYKLLSPENREAINKAIMKCWEFVLNACKTLTEAQRAGQLLAMETLLSAAVVGMGAGWLAQDVTGVAVAFFAATVFEARRYGTVLGGFGAALAGGAAVAYFCPFTAPIFVGAFSGGFVGLTWGGLTAERWFMLLNEEKQP